MSIFATALDFNADDHEPTCFRWVGWPADVQFPADRKWSIRADGARFVEDTSQPCTCHAGPLAYAASHILPGPDTPRRGSLELAEIPGFITDDGRALQLDEGEDPDYTHKVWPYLRVWSADGRASSQEFTGSPLILDKGQVQRVRDYLSEWLERCGEEKAT